MRQQMNEGFLLSICNDVTHIHVKLIKLVTLLYATQNTERMSSNNNNNKQNNTKKYANLLIKSVYF